VPITQIMSNPCNRKLGWSLVIQYITTENNFSYLLNAEYRTRVTG